VSAGDGPPELRDLVQIPGFLGPRPERAHRVQGVVPSGEPVSYEIGEGWSVLVFLSTACDGCHELWSALANPIGSPLPEGVRTVLVTHAPSVESPAEAARLSGAATLVMSDEAWTDYEVHSGPFFVVVDGATGRVASEGVAWSAAQIAAAVVAARAGG
jgi:hypothetical protein